MPHEIFFPFMNVVLVDGDLHQIKLFSTLAHKFNVSLTTACDLVHVLEAVLKVHATGISREDDQECQSSALTAKAEFSHSLPANF